MKRFLMCAAILLGSATVASAATITFEDLGVAPGTQLNPAAGVGVITGGFNFTPGPNNSSGFNDLHISSQTDHPYNGSTVGMSHTDVVLSLVGGAPFSISQFDFAGFTTNAEVPFRVIGNLAGGGQIFASFTPDGLVDGLGGVVDFQTFFFGAAWTNLSSVVWEHDGGIQGVFALDNIVVNQQAAVPEPGSMLLLGTGLAAAFLARRRMRVKN